MLLSTYYNTTCSHRQRLYNIEQNNKKWREIYIAKEFMFYMEKTKDRKIKK